MGAKRKLFKFSEIAKFENVVEHIQKDAIIPSLLLKGNWHKTFFKNNNPIVLELGCGKGEYTVGLSQRYPNKNFIGVDLKGNRIYTGAKHLLDNNIHNGGFLRTRIENITSCFTTDEVSEIWITFPDPQPQKARIKKRLTHPNFLAKYKTFLKPEGIIHLKTDSPLLYEYTLEVIKENKLKLIYHTNNLYNATEENIVEMREIKTYYETLFHSKGFTINYIIFQL